MGRFQRGCSGPRWSQTGGSPLGGGHVPHGGRWPRAAATRRELAPEAAGTAFVSRGQRAPAQRAGGRGSSSGLSFCGPGSQGQVQLFSEATGALGSWAGCRGSRWHRGHPVCHSYLPLRPLCPRVASAVGSSVDACERGRPAVSLFPDAGQFGREWKRQDGNMRQEALGGQHGRGAQTSAQTQCQSPGFEGEAQLKLNHTSQRRDPGTWRPFTAGGSGDVHGARREAACGSLPLSSASLPVTAGGGRPLPSAAWPLAPTHPVASLLWGRLKGSRVSWACLMGVARLGSDH